jgi:hypothetical protein
MSNHTDKAVYWQAQCLAARAARDCANETNGKLRAQRDELVALLADAAELMASKPNRMGKPEFYEESAMQARERIRERAVQFGVTKADTVMHQAAAVIRAALAKVQPVSPRCSPSRQGARPVSTLCAVCDQIVELHPSTHPFTPKRGLPK